MDQSLSQHPFQTAYTSTGHDYQPQGHLQRPARIKRESAMDHARMLKTESPSGQYSTLQSPRLTFGTEEPTSLPGASDFVKKLFKMLSDQSLNHIVSWGPNNDCFVVKDMNEFTKVRRVALGFDHAWLTLARRQSYRACSNTVILPVLSDN